MQRVDKTRRTVVRMILLPVFVLLLLCPARGQILIDLTERVPDSETVGGPGGGTATGQRPFPLPLEISIQDFYPVTLGRSDKLTVQILVKNVGSQPIDIPGSQKHRSTLKRGNQNQRTMSLFVQFLLPGGSELVRHFIGEAAGSSSVPGSTVTLYPGSSIAIRTTARLAVTEAEWAKLEGSTVTSFAGLSEAALDSDRFVEKSYSEKVISKDSVKVFMHK